MPVYVAPAKEVEGRLLSNSFLPYKYIIKRIVQHDNLCFSVRLASERAEASDATPPEEGSLLGHLHLAAEVRAPD